MWKSNHHNAGAIVEGQAFGPWNPSAGLSGFVLLALRSRRQLIPIFSDRTHVSACVACRPLHLLEYSHIN